MTPTPLDTLDTAASNSLQAAARWLAGWWRLLFLMALMLVLMLSPATWRRERRNTMAAEVYGGTAPNLVWFTLLSALISLIIIRIVVTTALSYGLSDYALEAVVRVLVLELLPLSAPVFVALRYSIPGADAVYARYLQGQGQGAAAHQSAPALQHVAAEFLPRVLAGVFACVTLVAISSIVSLVLAYFTVYGFVLSGLPEYTRRVGQVFNAPVSLIFGLKTVFFSLAVSVIPLTSALYDASSRMSRSSVELHGLVRMFALILLIEVASLVGNYA